MTQQLEIQDLTGKALTLAALRNAAALPATSGPFKAWMDARNIPAPSAMNAAELDAAIAWIERGLQGKSPEWRAAVRDATRALVEATNGKFREA